MTTVGQVGIQFAALAAGDAAWLAPLHRACFPDEPWPADAWRTLLGQPGVGGAAAVEVGEPTGFVLWRCVAEEAEILTLGVVPEHRGNGCGHGLVDHATAALPPAVTAIFLEVATDNRPARSLYAGRGFRPVGARPAYYRRPGGAVDALLLRLDRVYGWTGNPISQRLVGHHGRERL